jgi:replicative DNA helicase
MKTEALILKNLIQNEPYMRKVLPFLKDEYFTESHERKLFGEIRKFVLKYNKEPPVTAIEIAVKQSSEYTEREFEEASQILELTKDKEQVNFEWLLDTTEKFCQERSIYNAITDSLQILEGRDQNRGKGVIPALLSDALSVSFDPNIGHDYIENFEQRYDFYHKIEKRIPFDLDLFNKITKSGLPQKTLNICLAGTGVGKSLFMCHFAASCLTKNYNVLYITLEMAEEKIAERIDANLLNVTLDDLQMMPKDMYEKRMKKLKDTTKGRLIVKEYPTSSANSSHFRALINELAIKKNFKPDIIFIDYINICSSARLKPGANVNSYSLIKAIAEELRALAIEKKVPIVSATQTTRTGYSNSDPGLEDTSESFGLPATADFMFALVSNEELQKSNQVLVKQLKNRYNDINTHKRFVIGINPAKMKLYDLEQKAQDALAVEPTNITKPAFEKRSGNSSDKFKNFKV